MVCGLWCAIRGQALPQMELNGAMDTVREMWSFMRVRKKFRLAPIIISLLLLGMLFVFAGNAGVVSPFIYIMS